MIHGISQYIILTVRAYSIDGDDDGTSTSIVVYSTSIEFSIVLVVMMTAQYEYNIAEF